MRVIWRATSSVHFSTSLSLGRRQREDKPGDLMYTSVNTHTQTHTDKLILYIVNTCSLQTNKLIHCTHPNIYTIHTSVNNSHIHTHTHIHTHSQTSVFKHNKCFTQTYRQTMHTHTHAHTHIHTHIHTYTHIQTISNLLLQVLEVHGSG